MFFGCASIKGGREGDGEREGRMEGGGRRRRKKERDKSFFTKILVLK